jgi:hypothetical protein
VVRFAGTPLSGGGEAGRPASVRIAIPVRRTQQSWKVSVTADGRTYPDLMQGDLIVVRTSPTTPTGQHRLGLLWPFVGAALLVTLLGGALFARRDRFSADDPGPALPPPSG